MISRQATDLLEDLQDTVQRTRGLATMLRETQEDEGDYTGVPEFLAWAATELSDTAARQITRLRKALDIEEEDEDEPLLKAVA